MFLTYVASYVRRLNNLRNNNFITNLYHLSRWQIYANFITYQYRYFYVILLHITPLKIIRMKYPHKDEINFV